MEESCVCRKTAQDLRVQPRRNHSAIICGHRMLLWGGWDTTSSFNDVWEFNFDTQEWLAVTCTGTVPAGRAGHTAVCINNKMYIWGGKRCDGDYVNGLMALDLDTMEWKAIASEKEPKPSVGHKAVARGDCFYIFGGKVQTHPQAFEYGHTVKKYDTKTNRWERVCKIASKRYYSSMTAIGDKFYVFGGGYDNRYFNDVHVFDFTTNTAHTPLPNVPENSPEYGKSCPSARSSHGAQALDSNTLVIFGGWKGNTFNADLCWKLDLNSFIWTPVKLMGDVPTPRYGHSMLRYMGRFFLFGGFDDNKYLNDSYDLWFGEVSLKHLCCQWILTHGIKYKEDDRSSSATPRTKNKVLVQPMDVDHT